MLSLQVKKYDSYFNLKYKTKLNVFIKLNVLNLNGKKIRNTRRIMRPPQVLFLSNWYPNRKNPFQGDFVKRHAIAISLFASVRIRFFTGDEIKKSEQIDQKINAQCHEKILYFPKSCWALVNFIKKSYYIFKILREEKDVDLIHLNVMYYHFWPLLFVQKPLVISEHYSGLTPDKVQDMNGIQKWIFSRLLRKAKRVMPVSEYLAQGILRMAPASKISVVPNCVDTEIFALQEEVPKGEFVFLHISNMKKVKNVKAILKAVLLLSKKRSDFILRIGGNGDLSKVDTFREKHGLENHIQTLEAMSQKEVAVQMQQSHAFILYSHSETQGIVLLEALSVGRPFISSDLAAVQEYGKNNFGISIEGNNPKVLSNAMEYMMGNDSLATPAEMHEAVENGFSFQVIGAKFNRIYNEILPTTKI